MFYTYTFAHFYQQCSFILESAEIEGEINVGSDVVSDEDNHQLKLREVFLSRQLEIINANTIRFVLKIYFSLDRVKNYLKFL